MPISKLRFSNVGPFDDIEFEFDPQVNVFTGPNNSGKSTALWVLGEVAVYPFRLPRKLLSAAMTPMNCICKAALSTCSLVSSPCSTGKRSPIILKMVGPTLSNLSPIVVPVFWR